jgi:hypothetical protein
MKSFKNFDEGRVHIKNGFNELLKNVFERPRISLVYIDRKMMEKIEKCFIISAQIEKNSYKNSDILRAVEQIIEKIEMQIIMDKKRSDAESGIFAISPEQITRLNNFPLFCPSSSCALTLILVVKSLHISHLVTF